jgi:hypothetical protein
MGFESPWLLVGTLGVAVPLLIHLFLRRRAPLVPLDAVMVLVLSGGRTAVRLRLIHALLLATRFGMVLLASVLFSRPFLELPAEPGVASEQALALALVLDNSLSMRLSTDANTAWERARERAHATLRGLPAESEVFVVLAGRPVESHPRAGSGWDPETAASWTSRLGPSWASTDLAGALRQAASLIRSSPRRDRRIVVVSDFFDPALASLTDPAELAGLKVVPIDVGARFPENRAIVEAEARAAPDVSPTHVRVRVVVANGTNRTLQDVVTVRIEHNTAAGRMTCGPGARCAHEFLLGVEGGAFVGQVRLPPDDLPEDDVRWFTLAPRSRNAVLLVNGGFRHREELDATFFLSRALELGAQDGPGFTVTTVRPEDLSPMHLTAVSTVGIVDVGRLQPEQIKALSEFALSGGGVLITVGEGVDPATFGGLYPDLVPAGIRDIVDLGTGRPSPTVSWAASDHPAVSDLLASKGSLASVRVWQYAFLDNGWGAGSRLLASLSNGAPFLVERRTGHGTALTLLTSVDRSWTDLPLRPVFAPFVRKTFRYLAGTGASKSATSVIVGETRFVDVREGERATVGSPSGAGVTLSSPGDFDAIHTAGIYRVDHWSKGEQAPSRTEFFVANVDPAETGLRRLDPLPPALASPAPSGGSAPARPVRKVGMWPYVLTLLLSLFLLEAYLRGKA